MDATCLALVRLIEDAPCPFSSHPQDYPVQMVPPSALLTHRPKGP